MNENSSTNSSLSAPHHGLTAEMISRRAYELWEKEGRPENRDLHHWLRAEQELLAERGQGGSAAGQSSGTSGNTDTPMARSSSGAAAAARPTASAAPGAAGTAPKRNGTSGATRPPQSGTRTR